MQSTPLNTLPGPHDITRMQLDNGITILVRPNFNSPSVFISGYLANGSLFDPDEKLGLAYFTSLGLMRGTQHRSFQAIYDSLESAGASLGFSAGVHNTTFSGRALTEDLPLILELLADALCAPVFPAEQIERLRAQLMTGLAIRAQDTADMASLTFDSLVYAGHPYARPEDGYPETIHAISRDDLVEYRASHYGPKGMVIVVVGGVPPQEAYDKVLSYFGNWRNPSQPNAPELPKLKHLQKSESQRVVIPGKSQSDIVMGGNGPTRRSPDYMAASLGNSILGQFGMMGRIGDVVREQSGLAYYAYTSLNTGQGPGTWEVSAGVNPVNVEKAVDLIRQEIKRFVNEPVTSEELADSQANFIGRLPLSLESNAGVAGALSTLERFNLGLDYYQRYPGMVTSVTPEQVLETARRYLDPDRLAVAVAGPGNAANEE